MQRFCDCGPYSDFLNGAVTTYIVAMQQTSTLLLTNYQTVDVAECPVKGTPCPHVNMKLRVEHVNVNHMPGAKLPHIIILVADSSLEGSRPFYAGAEAIYNVLAVHFTTTQKTIMNQLFAIAGLTNAERTKIHLLNADGVAIDANNFSVNVVLEVHHMTDNEKALCDELNAMINELYRRDNIDRDQHISYLLGAIAHINKYGMPDNSTMIQYMSYMMRVRDEIDLTESSQ